MKTKELILLIFLILLRAIGFGQFDGYKLNPDGTYIVGGVL
jgi:hypothetical protein